MPFPFRLEFICYRIHIFVASKTELNLGVWEIDLEKYQVKHFYLEKGRSNQKDITLAKLEERYRALYERDKFLILNYCNLRLFNFPTQSREWKREMILTDKNQTIGRNQIKATNGFSMQRVNPTDRLQLVLNQYYILFPNQWN